MTLIPTVNIKPLDQKLYTLPLTHYAWIRKELTDLEKEGFISPSTLHFDLPLLCFQRKGSIYTRSHIWKCSRLQEDY